MTDDKGFYVTRVTAEQVKEVFTVEVSGVPIQSEHLRTSKELVKSLRDYSEGPTFYWGPICQKAAEEIERLQRELAASAAQYQEACDDANRFARERDEARASPEPSDARQAALDAAMERAHKAFPIRTLPPSEFQDGICMCCRSEFSDVLRSNDRSPANEGG
jgi:hypothetical protein